MRLQDLRQAEGTIVGAVVRGDEVIVPRGPTQILAGDHLVLFGTVEALDRAQTLFRS
ncbi:MAG: hypothetical protein LOD91_00690 [Limnochordales bacterium]